MRSPDNAFIRIRSPSSAPPPRRRVGSTASTAIRSLSSWSSRNRRISSSVRELLPDPPVPVMPSTGTRRRGVRSTSAGSRPVSARVIARASTTGSPLRRPSNEGGAVAARSTSHSRIMLLTIAGQPEPLAVLRGEDACHAAAVQQLDLPRDDHAAAPAVDLDVPGAALAQQLDQVREVLHVAALVRADSHALDVFLQRRGDHLVDRAVVAEVHHLRALTLQDPPHDVDRGVVPVEEAGGRHEPNGVRGHVEFGHVRASLGESDSVSWTSYYLPSGDVRVLLFQP